MEDGFLDIVKFNKSATEMDPFSRKNNIILPLLIKADEYGYSPPIPIFPDESGRISVSSIELYFKENVNNNLITPESQYMLLFTRCD